MNRSRQEALLSQFQREMSNIIGSKGDDYADDDRLSNFKLVAQICKIPVETVFMVFIATKAVRLGNLTGLNKNPKHESVDDTLIDLANYSALMDMALDEKHEAESF